MILVGPTLVTAFASAVTCVVPAAPAPAEALARLDELHRRRDDPAVAEETRKLVETLLGQRPGDYGVLWRASRHHVWLSDDGARSNQVRSELGKQAWDLAERAIAANPNDVAGHYWAAVGMGSYALGLGIVKALAKGLEGKFKNRLRRAAELDARYEYGGVEVAWGRFHEKLPWPKRDAKRAEEHYRRALKMNPGNLRAKVFLAELLSEEGRPADARQLLHEVRDAQPGRYDAPEERRSRAIGAWLLPRVLATIK